MQQGHYFNSEIFASEKPHNESFPRLYTRQKSEKTFARKTIKKQINNRRLFPIKRATNNNSRRKEEKKINLNFIFNMTNQWKNVMFLIFILKNQTVY